MTRAEFAGSDIVAHALNLLETSKLERIVILGRRGPHQIAMTPKELGELGHLAQSSPVVDPADFGSVVGAPRSFASFDRIGKIVWNAVVAIGPSSSTRWPRS